jgi:hypothetical protein
MYWSRRNSATRHRVSTATITVFRNRRPANKSMSGRCSHPEQSTTGSDSHHAFSPAVALQALHGAQIPYPSVVTSTVAATTFAHGETRLRRGYRHIGQADLLFGHHAGPGSTNPAERVASIARPTPGTTRLKAHMGVVDGGPASGLSRDPEKHVRAEAVPGMRYAAQLPLDTCRHPGRPRSMDAEPASALHQSWLPTVWRRYISLNAVLRDVPCATPACGRKLIPLADAIPPVRRGASMLCR